MQNELNGIVDKLLIGRDKDNLVTSPVQEVQVTFGGIEGDRHFGETMPSGGRTPYYPKGTEIMNFRQLSILSAEELTHIRKSLDLPELLPEWYGANIVLKGIPSLTILPPSSRLFFSSGAVITVDGDNSPCKSIGKVVQAQYLSRENLSSDLIKASINKRGIVGWVEKPGFIKVGDTIKAIIPEQRQYLPNK